MTLLVGQVAVPLSPQSSVVGYVPPGAQITITTAADVVYASTQSAYGTASSPAAGGTVVTMGAPLAAGKWKLDVTTHVWGTGTGITDNNNMQLVGVPNAPYILFVDAGSTQAPYTQSYRAVLSGSQTPAVTAVANASSTVTYSAQIAATSLDNDIYVGTSTGITQANGMPIDVAGTPLTLTNPPGAEPFTLYVTAFKHTHTLAVMIITPR